MADIMIVLLIIFMVITPMLQKGVDVKLPTSANTKERQAKEKTIIVAVKNDAARTVYFKGQKLDNPAELTEMVKKGLEDLPEDQKVLYLKADEALPYTEVKKVMDLCRDSRIYVLNLGSVLAVGTPTEIQNNPDVVRAYLG